MRSCIALLGFGVLIVRIRILRPPLAPTAPGNGWKLGVAFSMVGLLTLALATCHYSEVRHDIERDTYAPPDRWVALSSLVLISLGAFVVLYVFQAPVDTATAALID